MLVMVLPMAMRAQTNTYQAYFNDVPFGMPAFSAPIFPNTEANIKQFGGVGDGQTLCTEAFRKAFAYLEQKGGGRLTVPAGVWFTGPIDLKSNTNLHLEKGAIILFSPDEEHYPLVNTYYEGLASRRCHSPIYGLNLVNVAITGQGVIDGNGQAWRPLKREKVTEGQWKEMTRGDNGFFKGDRLWYPSKEFVAADSLLRLNKPISERSEADWLSMRRFLRPVMVSLVGCKNVLLQGVIFQNSPAWNIHPLMCENVIIDGVTARNPSYAQNGDGLDLESCRNALIINSVFDAGDDGICIKSGKDAEGRKRARPCENVVVDGCTVFAGHGGFVVGSEMSGGVRNILVKNCQFLGTDVGLRFKSRRGRGGIVENIFIRGISMTDIKVDAIIFNLYYGGQSVVEMMQSGTKANNVDVMPVDETTPQFRNIHIENIMCQSAGRAMLFNGLPEMPIENIDLKNIHITAREDAAFFNCKNISRKNVNIRVAK
ncbi:MAG: glycoside hydrolase family 28 protein [Prevotella sp.]|nr:glycoside hydrolase family 28 protein [Prevotella sp.]